MPVTEKISNGFLVISLLLFLLGGFLYLTPQSKKSVSLSASPTVMERNFAIEAAKKSGARNYTFTTNFIPGIGMITDPEAYKRQYFR